MNSASFWDKHSAQCGDPVLDPTSKTTHWPVHSIEDILTPWLLASGLFSGSWLLASCFFPLAPCCWFIALDPGSWLLCHSPGSWQPVLPGPHCRKYYQVWTNLDCQTLPHLTELKSPKWWLRVNVWGNVSLNVMRLLIQYYQTNNDISVLWNFHLHKFMLMKTNC